MMESLMIDLTNAVHRTQLGDELVNSSQNYKDELGVVHIRNIDDQWAEWHLVNGEWFLYRDKDMPF